MVNGLIATLMTSFIVLYILPEFIVIHVRALAILSVALVTLLLVRLHVFYINFVNDLVNIFVRLPRRILFLVIPVLILIVNDSLMILASFIIKVGTLVLIECLCLDIPFIWILVIKALLILKMSNLYFDFVPYSRFRIGYIYPFIPFSCLWGSQNVSMLESIMGLMDGMLLVLFILNTLLIVVYLSLSLTDLIFVFVTNKWIMMRSIMLVWSFTNLPVSLSVNIQISSLMHFLFSCHINVTHIVQLLIISSIVVYFHLSLSHGVFNIFFFVIIFLHVLIHLVLSCSPVHLISDIFFHIICVFLLFIVTHVPPIDMCCDITTRILMIGAYHR